MSFNGGAELIPAVLGGHCDAGIFSQSEVLTNTEGLRPLVFFGEGHSPLPELADVPNLEETGYGDLEVPGGCFRGICAPKGLPEDVKTYLADTIEEAYNTDMFQDFLASQGLQGNFTKLGDFGAYNNEYVAEKNIRILSITRHSENKWYKKDVCVIIEMDLRKRQSHGCILADIRTFEGLRYVEEI